MRFKQTSLCDGVDMSISIWREPFKGFSPCSPCPAMPFYTDPVSVFLLLCPEGWSGLDFTKHTNAQRLALNHRSVSIKQQEMQILMWAKQTLSHTFCLQFAYCPHSVTSPHSRFPYSHTCSSVLWNLFFILVNTDHRHTCLLLSNFPCRKMKGSCYAMDEVQLVLARVFRGTAGHRGWGTAFPWSLLTWTTGIGNGLPGLTPKKAQKLKNKRMIPVLISCYISWMFFVTCTIYTLIARWCDKSLTKSPCLPI